MVRRAMMLHLRFGAMAGVTLVLGAAGMLALHAAEPAPNKRPTVQSQSPHWTASGCNACHKVQNGKVAAIAADVVDAVCLRCHDGNTAVMERHPIGRTFEREDVIKPPSWPVPADKLSCITCHDMLPGCKETGAHSAANRDFLRSMPAEVTDFCTTCHVPSKNERFDPHRMLTASGTMVASACRFCHSKDMPADRTTRVGEADLVSEERNLCMRCHQRHVDYFDPGHFHATVTDRVRTNLKGFSISSTWGVSFNGEALFPLTKKGTLTCSTCHNPHPEGLFPHDSLLATGAQQLNSRTNHGLRVPGSQVCRACHGR